MIEQFNSICYFRKTNPGGPGTGLSVNEPSLQPVKQSLAQLGQYLNEIFGVYKGIKCSIEVSKGQAYFPSILHASILPPGQAVSKGIYVVICFDILGRGALVGCAESITQPQGLNTLKRNQRKKNLTINVDGQRPTTKYNDVFENPEEFYAGLQSGEVLLAHLKHSLDLAFYHLGLGDSESLTVKDKVIAGISEPGFNPSNMEDARTKKAMEIAARRGQRKFRNAVLEAYERRCAVTGCTVEPVLEAAHIMPYMGDQTNHIQNGILLRSDIHMLFDLGLLTIDCNLKTIKIHSSLQETPYYMYHSKKIRLPRKENQQPHIDALKHHNDTEYKN